MTDIIDRYGTWLPRLTETDRDYVRNRHAEVLDIRAADPDRPEWLELYFRWTATAIDAEDPVAALREAVESEDDADPAEMRRALAALDRTSTEWDEWWPAWHPSPN